jgi:hypothetical protein
MLGMGPLVAMDIAWCSPRKDSVAPIKRHAPANAPIRPDTINRGPR